MTSGANASAITRGIAILTFVFGLALSPAVFPQARGQKPETAPPEEQAPALAVPKDYHYNARGRRDPFVNPVPKPVAKVAPPPPAVAARPPGLKGVLVAEAEVIGIVVSREPAMNVVTIQAPGGRRYFIRVGDALYDAVVKNIKSDSVTFAVTAPGGDQKASREIVRKLRGENK
ncbi:MAG TPA: hypothetical protein VGK48_24015 [Terriglobia bacterium]|jgi:hypothetical protein